MNNLRLVAYLKVIHYWAPFEKSHMVGHHLIFDDHKKKLENYFIVDFDMKVFESKFDMKLFGSHFI